MPRSQFPFIMAFTIRRVLLLGILLATAASLVAQAGDAPVVPPGKEPGVGNRELLDKRRDEFRKMSPEERVAKRRELHVRMNARLEVLEKKEAAGTLTKEETRHLERMRVIKKRMEQHQPAPAPAALPPPETLPEK